MDLGRGRVVAVGCGTCTWRVFASTEERSERNGVMMMETAIGRGMCIWPGPAAMGRRSRMRLRMIWGFSGFVDEIIDGKRRRRKSLKILLPLALLRASGGGLRWEGHLVTCS